MCIRGERVNFIVGVYAVRGTDVLSACSQEMFVRLRIRQVCADTLETF